MERKGAKVKSRTRSKSPFRSFRWPKKSPGKSDQAVSDDEDNVPRSTFERPDGDELEGTLVRKHEWESTTKKASNRSWDRVCVVMKGSRLAFYKDQKTYRSSPDATYRGEPPIEVSGGTARVATDYTKKKHVFRLQLANGGDYLFQANDDDDMTQWVTAINQVVQETEGAVGGKSQTLPAGTETRGEPKKRSFFTLKKK